MVAGKSYYEQQIDKITEQCRIPEYHYIQVRQSKDFMEEFYGERIELHKIAMAACMSRFHFIRVFQSIYGITPRQYLKDVRIDKAKALIRCGLPITQVCYDVGYDSLPTFSTAFKNGTGLSPKAYRKVNYSNQE